MEGQRAERTRALIASYRYSVNRLEPQARRVRPASTARESPRQIIANVADGDLTERRQTRPTTPSIFEKEAFDKEMMQLKKTNRALSNENTKLKTNNISLKEQARRLEEKLQKKPQTSKFVRTESAATKRTFSILKKERDEIQQEFMTLKQDTKYARLTELQTEKQINAAELKRLRELLQQEKMVTQGLKQERRKSREQFIQKRKEMQDVIQKLQQQIYFLKKNDQPAAERVRARSRLQMRKFDHLSPETLELKAEVESLKKQLEKSQQEINQLLQYNLLAIKSTKDMEVQTSQCQNCKSLRSQSTKLKIKIQQLKTQIKQLSKNRKMDDEMLPPTVEESNKLRRFITLILTEQNISLDEAAEFFKGQDENSTEISLLNLMDIFEAEPFSFVTERYSYIMIFHLCLSDRQNNQAGKFNIREIESFDIANIRHNFKKFIGKFTIPSQSERKELFKAVVEFLGDRNRKISIYQCLEQKVNEVRTSINEDNFRSLMGQLEVNEDCILEMMRKMVIQSPDLEHLDFQILFKYFEVEEDDCNSPTIDRNAEENYINPNPETVRNQGHSNQEEDIIFMNLDPNKLFPTQQDFPI